MKKKLFIILLTMLALAACAIVFAACGFGGGDSDGDGGSTHEHTYSEQWSYDETYHWHAATCGHANEVSGKAEHTIADEECNVCSYRLPT